MINSALERQANSTNELLRRLIEERDGNFFYNSNVNPSSSSYAISFAQTNPQTSGTLTGDAIMTNPSARSMNHFHSRTIIEGSIPSFRMLAAPTKPCTSPYLTPTPSHYPIVCWASCPTTSTTTQHGSMPMASRKLTTLAIRPAVISF
jgi:hypothetical protein